MSKVLVKEATLTSIADAIREKNGSTDTYYPNEMAAAITAIETGGGDIPEEGLTITGNCNHRFAYNGWNWFIDAYAKKIKTNNITGAGNMFYYSDAIKEIPFEINFDASKNVTLTDMFSQSGIETVPKINNCKPTETSSMFFQCKNITQYPEDMDEWFDWSFIENLTNSYSGRMNSMFAFNHSLRKFPVGMIKHTNKYMTSNTPYYSMANTCSALDEITNLPVLFKDIEKTTNLFTTTFNNTRRIKDITFETDNGAPYVVQWKAQTIDLSKEIGYGFTSASFYNTGLTTATQIKDDTTYQALKDNVDSWTSLENYSRYNRTSAINTINSLPDTSAYLATAGGTNTIKFKGAAGALTDGGAINTMTEEEIAVATAKGWTVSFT